MPWKEYSVERGGPGRSRTADLRFRKSTPPTESKLDNEPQSADSGKVLQNPQPPPHYKDLTLALRLQSSQAKNFPQFSTGP